MGAAPRSLNARGVSRQTHCSVSVLLYAASDEGSYGHDDADDCAEGLGGGMLSRGNLHDDEVLHNIRHDVQPAAGLDEALDCGEMSDCAGVEADHLTTMLACSRFLPRHHV